MAKPAAVNGQNINNCLIWASKYKFEITQLKFGVKADGTIANGRVFFDAMTWTKTKPGAPDGMKVDQAGNLYGAGPGRLYIFAPDGTHLGSIETGVATANCAWGDDGTTLYITADKAIYRIKLNTKGVGF